jgi:pilus assembly protein TadC
VSRGLLGGILAALAVLVLGRPGGESRVRRWTRPAQRGRRPRSPRRDADVIPGPLVLDLVAAVLAAGAPVTTTLDLVAEALREYAPGQAEHLTDLASRQDLGLRGRALGRPGWVQALDRTLLLARDAGVPPAGVLVSAAADERRRRANRRRLAAARLGVRVVLPTGLCLLPAFVLLTVVPMVVALLGIG